ncbi:MAG: glycosyltransferase [Actinobacteria bacterium]|nr:glycosyltransferase [Actinomycetota bacterium]
MRVDEDNRARPGGGAEHPVIVSYRRPVRIAHVTDCYLPRTGGIETQVRALAMQQRSSGDDVRIITATGGRDGVFSGDDIVDGLTVHRVAARLPFDLPIHPRTRREVAQILKAHPVDVVHIHAGVVSPFAWGALRAAHEVGLPVLVTVHSVWGPLARPGFRASRAVVRWDAWGAQLSAVSDVAAAEIARALPGAGEVLVLPNAIDPADWSTYRVEGEPEELRISTVMRLAPRKRIIPFLKIIDQAQRALQGTPRLRVAVIGDGPERARAERFVRDHGLESSVSFLGRLDRAEILEVFANTDIVLQPSVKESFGLAALEARSAGLPIIARSQTGTTQFVHDGVEGLLADSDAGMAQAIMRVARDRALLDRIAAHNQSTPPDDTWPRLLALVQDAYLAAQSRAAN